MLLPMPDIAAVLRELRVETPAASTLRFQTTGATLAYRPGQYIMIDPHQFVELGPEIREREAHRGKPLGPGYFSLSSDATEPELLEITVKIGAEGPPGLLPGFLVRRMHAGRSIHLLGPGGKYHLPDDAPAGVSGFLHLCAGSGVAPNRGMIRHGIARKWPQRQLLLVQDRSESDELFGRELRELAARHPDALRVLRVHSRPGRESVTVDLIRQEAEGFLDLATTWAFLCGPNH